MKTYDPKNYRAEVKLLGKRLFKMAIDWSHSGHLPASKSAAYAIIDDLKGCKKFATKKARHEATDRIMSIAQDIHEQRRIGKVRLWSYNNPGNDRSQILGHKSIARLPLSSLDTRRVNRRERLILAAAQGQIESYSGDTTTTIHYGEPAAETATARGEQYSRSCTYAKTDCSHHITVAPDWFTRVHLRGLDSIDGMLTLDADPIDSDGYTVYRASWLRSKGKRLSAEHGFIAIGDNGAAHARTESGAKAILTRRANEIRYTRHERKIRQQLAEMQLNGYADIIVSIGDSLAAGNCRAGTEQFRDRHFSGRDTATIEEVLSVESMRGLAINACLRAIRRAKIDHATAA